MRFAVAVLVAAPLLAASTAALADTPRIKAGLWEQTQAVSGLPMQVPATTSRFCTDDAVQARLSMFTANSAAGECSPPRIAAQGGGFTFDVACRRAGGMSSTVHAVVHGDLNSSYTTDTTMTFTGMPAGAAGMPAAMSAHTVARYVGACPAGMRPGDVTINGRTMNLLDHMAKPRS